MSDHRSATAGRGVPARHRQPPPFGVEVHPERETARVAPAGEVDRANVAEVERRLTELDQVGFSRLVLDLGQVSFIDSSVLHLIRRWHDRPSRDGRSTFELREGRPEVQRLLDLTGLAGRVPLASP